MMPASYSADLQWRVIWFVHILQNSVAEASFFLGVCYSTVEPEADLGEGPGGVAPLILAKK